MSKILLAIIFSALKIQEIRAAYQYFYDNTDSGGVTPGASISGVQIGGLANCVLVYFGGPSTPNGVSLMQVFYF